MHRGITVHVLRCRSSCPPTSQSTCFPILPVYRSWTGCRGGSRKTQASLTAEFLSNISPHEDSRTRLLNFQIQVSFADFHGCCSAFEIPRPGGQTSGTCVRKMIHSRGSALPSSSLVTAIEVSACAALRWFDTASGLRVAAPLA